MLPAGFVACVPNSPLAQSSLAHGMISYVGVDDLDSKLTLAQWCLVWFCVVPAPVLTFLAVSGMLFCRDGV